MAYKLILLACILAMSRPSEAISRTRPRTLQRQPHLLSVMLSESLSEADCGGQTLSCTSCTAWLQCARLAGVYRPIRTVDCTGDTPYCSAGACVATPDDTCAQPPQPAGSFTCNGDGYFPDPGSCRRYWLCVSGTAYQYDCSASTVYSHARAMCVPSSEATCATASCSASSVGVYQPYANDPEVFFVCRDVVAGNALVAACPDNHTVDAVTGDCVLTCLAEGRLPDADDETRYYECTSTGLATYSEPVPLICPSGSTFNAERQRCLTGHEGEPVVEKSGFNEEYYEEDPTVPESDYNIPSKVLLGASTAAYQVEGAWNYSDKGVSIQDAFYHERPTYENGDIAANSFFKYLEDVALLQELKLDYYRFSLSWPRLLPSGDSAHPSKTGIDYYNALIDALIAAGVQPVVTIYHWDLPEVYQNDGGWLNSAIQDRFVDYATFCFEQFGDRVKSWILVNEPLTQCLYGYELGVLAPGVQQAGTGGYLCNHNMVLAHAKAYRAYQAKFKAQGGKIGSSLNTDFAQPASDSQADRDAADRHFIWQYAWFADPLHTGDYPALMRQTIDELSAAEGRNVSRLPQFTDEEKATLRGAYDFLGLNNYGATLVSAPTSERDPNAAPSYYNDMYVTTSSDPNWISTARGGTFTVTPWALVGCARWVSQRYDNPPIWVTENGYPGDVNEGLADVKRIGYYSGNMRGLMKAVNTENLNVIGYTAWSLMDNYEWSVGYKSKFGIVYVDFNDDDRPRTIKDSGRFFQNVSTTRHVPYVRAT